MKKSGILVVLAGLGLSVAFCSRSLAQETKVDTAVEAEKAASEHPTAAVKAEVKPAVAKREDAGRLEADTMMYDFGTVLPGTRVKGKFVLTNTGGQTLRIKDPIKTQCGCTKPKLEKYSLEPGESVNMQVAFTAPTKAGKTTKKIYVSTLAPGKPAKLTLSITADVRRKLDFKPKQWVFELRESEANKVPVELTSPDGKAFSIVRYTSTQDAVKVIFDPNARALKHVLAIEVDLDTVSRVRNGAVTIWTDHAKDKKVTIEYRTQAPFKVRPGSLTLTNLERGEKRNKSLVVVSSYDEDFEVGEVKSDKGFVELGGISKREDGYEVNVVVMVPKTSKLKVVKDRLTIKIKDRPQDTINVLCYLVVKRGGAKLQPVRVKDVPKVADNVEVVGAAETPPAKGESGE